MYYELSSYGVYNAFYSYICWFIVSSVRGFRPVSEHPIIVCSGSEAPAFSCSSIGWRFKNYGMWRFNYYRMGSRVPFLKWRIILSQKWKMFGCAVSVSRIEGISRIF